MAGMGSAPKPASEVRKPNRSADSKRLAAGVTRLPSEGRTGDAPKWPISKAKASELEIWKEIWATPQAVAWERLGWERTVARYVRVLVEAEKPKAAGVVLQEARQFEDRLGLHPMAMLRLRWEIVADEVQERRDQPDLRGRLRPVAEG